MKNKVLFGEAHLLTHDKTWLIRGLFEVEDKFYKLTGLFEANKGDIIAFTSIDGGKAWTYVQLGNKEVFDIDEVLGVWENISANHHSKPLIDAVKNSDVDKVRALLEDGADPNSVDNSGNPALLLSTGKSKEIAKTLVSFGADPNRENSNGVSPFSFASDNNHGSFLPVLLLYQPQPTYNDWLREMRNSMSQ